MISCLRYVARERGTSGLYAGLGSKLWQTVLTAAVQLMIYEQLAAALTRRIARRSQRWRNRAQTSALEESKVCGAGLGEQVLSSNMFTGRNAHM